MSSTITDVPSIGSEADASKFEERPRLSDVARRLEPLIRSVEDLIEDERKVPEEVTAALYDGGIYRAFLPAEVGGLDVHPVEWLEAVEEVSRINGSVGWLCMLHTGSTWAPPETMRRILANERWITAGNVAHAGGKIRKVEGGYRVSGRWPFASGSPEATYLYGLSVLHDENDNPVVSPKDGLPYFLSAYVPASETKLHDTWDGMGLRGTGSGDIEFDDVFVPREMVNESGIWSHPYASPLQHAGFNGMAHAAHAIGLLVAAIDEFSGIVNAKFNRDSYSQMVITQAQSPRIALALADATVRSMRLLLQDIVTKAYEDAIDNIHIDYELRVLMHEINVYIVQGCRDATRRLFKELGPKAVFRKGRINRIVRDIETASQHLIVVESSLVNVGQYWLTRDFEGGPYLDPAIGGGAIRGPHPVNYATREKLTARGA